jgi:hypothetical protein
MKRVTRRKKRKPLPSTTLSHRHCKNQNRRKLASSIDSDGDQIKIIASDPILNQLPINMVSPVTV